ncbi:GUN4 domain-containing protein [uncultured Nostoc sp.]|uniref:GUN4 domain-containing protein n=1 Tax=uncultured Nostoc sp. TaxID=340711 RepID=UPI0035CB9561
MELEVENRPQTVREFRELLGLVNSKTQGDVQLKSTVGMDYTGLGDLLADGKWKEADEETARVMLAVANREEEGWLDIKSIDKFPCEDLRTIDQLWEKYSNGRFGFSAQKKIYQSLGGTRYYDQKIWEAFGEVVGWRKRGEWLYYKHITFNIKAPEAQFPACLWILVFKIMSSFEFMNVGWDIFFRIETCDLPSPKSEIQNPELSELDDIKLISAVDIDYTHLRDLLATGKWKDADEETARVMLAVAKREEEGWLDIESSDNFPYEDLRTIDQLWVKYSDGHFGFSVQKHIYKNMGGTEQIWKYNSEVWRKFGEIIGWKKIGEDWLYYKDITFDITAPKAHLPVVKCLFSFLGRDWEGLVEVACYVGSKCGGGFSLISRRDLLCYEPKSEIKTSKLAQLNDIELISSVGMDYTQLCNLLMRGMWQKADEETAELMLAVAKRKNKNWLDYESISNFPCEDLRTIDQLWVKYSNGRFGFSVQKRIYRSLAATTRQDKDNVWEAFGDVVGWSAGRHWLYDYEITFDITAPEGHLPMSIGYSQDWTWIGDWEDKVRLGEFFRYLFLRKDL